MPHTNHRWILSENNKFPVSTAQSSANVPKTSSIAPTSQNAKPFTGASVTQSSARPSSSQEHPRPSTSQEHPRPSTSHDQQIAHPRQTTVGKPQLKPISENSAAKKTTHGGNSQPLKPPRTGFKIKQPSTQPSNTVISNTRTTTTKTTASKPTKTKTTSSHSYVAAHARLAKPGTSRQTPNTGHAAGVIRTQSIQREGHRSTNAQPGPSNAATVSRSLSDNYHKTITNSNGHRPRRELEHSKSTTNVSSNTNNISSRTSSAPTLVSTSLSSYSSTSIPTTTSTSPITSAAGSGTLIASTSQSQRTNNVRSSYSENRQERRTNRTMDRYSQTNPVEQPLSVQNSHSDVVSSRAVNLLAARYQSRQHSRNREQLPDILNSHVAPPYQPHQNGRSAQRRRDNSRRHHGQTDLTLDEFECCSCGPCIRCITKVTTFRWVLVILALLGVCCVLAGIILGTLHMTLNLKYLTLSLMFIGLGVVLVLVVGIGWKCTPGDHEPCHLMFGLGIHSSANTRRRRHARRTHHQWHGGPMSSEFRNRQPPPTYNASMHHQQHQQHQIQQQQPISSVNQTQSSSSNTEAVDNYSLPSSPPPTYRSQASLARPGLHITFPPANPDQPESRPPTYRSRMSTLNRPGLPNRENEGEGNSEQESGITNPACDTASSEGNVINPTSITISVTTPTIPEVSSSTDVIPADTQL